MRIQGSDIVIQQDPLSYGSGYTFLQGSPYQTYDPQAGVFNPSRSIYPLVIMPWVSASDPQGEYSGQCSLHSVTAVFRKMVNGAWVDIEIDNTDTNNYFISDGTTIHGITAPAGAVVIRKNIPPTEVAAVIIHANVVDAVDGLVKSFESTVEMTTKTASTVQYKLRVADETSPYSPYMALNPMNIAANAQGKQPVTCSVKLYGDNVPVADSDAKYFWYFNENGNWVQILPDNQVWLLTSFLDNVNYELPRTIQVDLRFIDELHLFASASPIGDTTPTQPDYVHGAERVHFDISRICPKDIQGFVFGDVGIKFTGDELMKRYLQLRGNGGDLTDAEVEKFFRIDWYKEVNSASSFVSRGKSVEGHVQSDFGATRSAVCRLNPKVWWMNCYKPIVTSDGKYWVDGQGRYVCGQNYRQV